MPENNGPKFQLLTKLLGLQPLPPLTELIIYEMRWPLISLINKWMGTGESQEWGLSGRVQCVGLMSWVNTRPLICLASPARSANAREARFSGECQ